MKKPLSIALALILSILAPLALCAHAQAEPLPDSRACQVYVDLHYPKYKAEMVKKLETLGYTIASDKRDAAYEVENYGIWEFEGEGSSAVASFGAITDYGIENRVEVRGDDNYQILWSKKNVVNRLTAVLLNRLPTCEQAQERKGFMIYCDDQGKGPCRRI